jgi:integrase
LPAKSPTFIQIAEDLIKDAELRVKLGENAPSLVRDYKQRLKAYAKPFFGNTKVVDVDARKLRDFKAWLAERNLKPSTINPIMSFVSMVLRRAEEDRHLRFRPTAPRSKHKDSPRPAFSRDEYKRLLAFLQRAEVGNPTVIVRGHTLDWQIRSMTVLMTNAFLRPGDLFVLKNEHVQIKTADDGQRYLKLDFPASKGHADPVISMPMAVPVYERILARQKAAGYGKPDDYVFMPELENRTHAKEVVRRLFNEVLRLTKLKTNAKGEERTMYSLRHTAIVFRLTNAENLDTLTLARNCRTSVEMLDRFYARSLTAEMNLDKLHSFKRETRYA